MVEVRGNDSFDGEQPSSGSNFALATGQLVYCAYACEHALWTGSVSGLGISSALEYGRYSCLYHLPLAARESSMQLYCSLQH